MTWIWIYPLAFLLVLYLFIRALWRIAGLHKEITDAETWKDLNRE